MVEKTVTREQAEVEKSASVKPAKKTNKYLSGFVKFLAYGGWILVLAIALGVVIAISVLT